MTGDTSFDALLREERGVPYSQFRLAEPGASTRDVETALDELAGLLRVNFPAYTQEVRFTDRVMRFPVLYQPGWMLEKGVPTLVVEGGVMTMGHNGLNLLYNTVSGDPGDPLYFPINAVRWRTLPRDFAALVTESAPTRFAARVYHFGSDTRRFEAELLLLEAGDYQFTLTDAKTGQSLQTGTVTETSGRRTLALTLPPAVETLLQVKPTQTE